VLSVFLFSSEKKNGKSCRFISHVFVHWMAGNLLCPTHAGERLSKVFCIKQEFFFIVMKQIVIPMVENFPLVTFPEIPLGYSQEPVNDLYTDTVESNSYHCRPIVLTRPFTTRSRSLFITPRFYD